MNTESDQTLVSRSLNGDRRAFAGLVARYAAAVNAVAFSVTRDHHAAEDISQDVFVQAMQQLHQLRVASLFGRWILKMARHRAIRAGQSRRLQLSLDHTTELSSMPDGDSQMESAQLLDALMRLPERERRLMMLRYFNGHSVKEIARITRCPVGTVTKQLSRGYSRLRMMLSEVLT